MSSASLRLFPEQASTMARQVDAVTLTLLAICSLVALGIIVCIVAFSIRYRRRVVRAYWPSRHGYAQLELAWIIIPLLIFLGFFGWGAHVYLIASVPPKGADEILVVGKQWMWEFQHANGAREDDVLHVPVGRPVRLLMISQDVIHSFFIPAFRVKQDVLPAKYTQLWFQATRVGEYRLHCAEFCGTMHAAMGGRLVAMSEADYARWLGEHAKELSPQEAGRQLFVNSGCTACHQAQDGHRAPRLEGLYGSEVRLDDGTRVVANEDYLRESIVDPAAKIVGGYKAIMPTYTGHLTEIEVMQLIAYIKSLADDKGEAQP